MKIDTIDKMLGAEEMKSRILNILNHPIHFYAMNKIKKEFNKVLEEFQKELDKLEKEFYEKHKGGEMSKLYKIRMNCTGFHDIVVRAKSKKDAIEEAYMVCQCPHNVMEFGEFLEVEDDDKIDYE